MAKKTASARSGASRNKPRPQKSVQLVRPISTATELEVDDSEEETTGTVATSTAAEPTVEAEVEEVEEVAEVKEPKAAKAVKEVKAPRVEATKPVVETTAAPKSASARLAARRQTAQQTQKRAPATMISAENYKYVRKDLIFIAILAAIMFSAIIILHFVPAIGG